MRVVFLWSEVSGYMATCFRALANRPDIEPLFLIKASRLTHESAPFSEALMNDLPCKRLLSEDFSNAIRIRGLVVDHRPDMIVHCGWFIPAYRDLLTHTSFRNVPSLMMMDTPWWGHVRQWLGRIILRRTVRNVALMIVTGERSWQYAIRLGIPPQKIRRGMYGVDYRNLSQCLERRKLSPDNQHAWPRQFLFAGRYAPEKALDILVAGYRQYRQCVAEQGEPPWPLVCCGSGPLASLLSNIEGIENRGFVQPAQMLDEMVKAGVFILPSRYDPWPLALVEACAAGLPVIASDACGSAVELIRPEFNGHIVPTGDADELSRAMMRCHKEHEQLQSWGERASQFAAAYSAEIWADRMIQYFSEVVGK